MPNSKVHFKGGCIGVYIYIYIDSLGLGFKAQVPNS